jgi:hypothetical protein
MAVNFKVIFFWDVMLCSSEYSYYTALYRSGFWYTLSAYVQRWLVFPHLFITDI